eukprot:Nk52_evm39s485 gene=Nk52_evmTU39s485
MGKLCVFLFVLIAALLVVRVQGQTFEELASYRFFPDLTAVCVSAQYDIWLTSSTALIDMSSGELMMSENTGESTGDVKGARQSQVLAYLTPSTNFLPRATVFNITYSVKANGNASDNYVLRYYAYKVEEPLPMVAGQVAGESVRYVYTSATAAGGDEYVPFTSQTDSFSMYAFAGVSPVNTQKSMVFRPIDEQTQKFFTVLFSANVTESGVENAEPYPQKEFTILRCRNYQTGFYGVCFGDKETQCPLSAYEEPVEYVCPDNWLVCLLQDDSGDLVWWRVLIFVLILLVCVSVVFGLGFYLLWYRRHRKNRVDAEATLSMNGSTSPSNKLEGVDSEGEAVHAEKSAISGMSMDEEAESILKEKASRTQSGGMGGKAVKDDALQSNILEEKKNESLSGATSQRLSLANVYDQPASDV